MFCKRDILGIKCEILRHYSEEDEKAILLGGQVLFVKTEHLDCLRAPEKFAAIGESPFFLRSSALLRFGGPSSVKKYLLTLNSRGYLRDVFVNEQDVIFL